jgi:hypothetical protein
VRGAAPFPLSSVRALHAENTSPRAMAERLGAPGRLRLSLLSALRNRTLPAILLRAIIVEVEVAVVIVAVDPARLVQSLLSGLALTLSGEGILVAPDHAGIRRLGRYRRLTVGRRRLMSRGNAIDPDPAHAGRREVSRWDLVRLAITVDGSLILSEYATQDSTNRRRGIASRRIDVTGAEFPLSKSRRRGEDSERTDNGNGTHIDLQSVMTAAP